MPADRVTRSAATRVGNQPLQRPVASTTIKTEPKADPGAKTELASNTDPGAKTDSGSKTEPGANTGPGANTVQYHSLFGGGGDIIIRCTKGDPVNFRANYNVLVISCPKFKKVLQSPESNKRPATFALPIEPEDMALLLHFLHEVDDRFSLPPVKTSLEGFVNLQYLVNIYGGDDYLSSIVQDRAKLAAWERLINLGDSPTQNQVLDLLAAVLMFEMSSVFHHILALKTLRTRHAGWSVIDDVTRINAKSLAARHKPVYTLLLAIERAHRHWSIDKSELKVDMSFCDNVYLSCKSKKPVSVTLDDTEKRFKLWKQDRDNERSGRLKSQGEVTSSVLCSRRVMVKGL